MILYTCAVKERGGSLGHPCGKAAKALEGAGHAFDVRVVGGFRNVPFSRGGGKRDELVEISGQPDAPVLRLPDGTAIAGSSNIVEWASAQ